MTAQSRPPKTPASLTMLARHAGVSIATASRVMNGVTNKASAETVARVRAAAAELNYRPAGAGQALRRRESRIVAMLAAALANPVMGAIASSVEIGLRGEGLVMSLCDTREQAAVQDAYLEEMQAQMVRAVVLAGAVDSPGLDRMRAEGPPLVFVNRPDPGDPGSAYVGIDNRAAGRDLAQAVLGLCCGPVALVHGLLDRTAGTYRRQGILEAFAAAGRGAPELAEIAAPGLNQLEAGRAAMAQALAAGLRPAAVICLSDALAYGAHRALEEAALPGGEAVRFFGFDDLIFNDWVAGWLSSVAVPRDLYGPAVMEVLGQLWQGAPPAGPVYLPHHLSLRGG
ncbi:LacI family DNA-binding transcriptional regulator [Poseidonocella sp. HB161398]|uniref:LacI family DNA-binding transcriptional regulator n=1 Tax=Poseidonocella sp. HB161398 TaxID=2320855 RepID=UPI0011096132|nr:LacI family DNA-binding transcriptional regulator [Poseidonocella sp. HB161398]